MIKSKDYRFTDYEKIPFSPKYFEAKKQEFMVLFRDKKQLNHPNTDNIYEQVKKKGSSDYKVFSSIYCGHCAYCGIAITIKHHQLFQVDHFLPQNPESRTQVYDTEFNPNSIDNLVYACNNCNNWKSNFTCKSVDTLKLLHPDKNYLPRVFSRQNNYGIKINPEFDNNPEVIDFFKKLHLGDDTRRVEYFISKFSGFYNKCLDLGILSEYPIELQHLSRLYFKIMSKWNSGIL